MALGIARQIGTPRRMPTSDRGAGEAAESTIVNVSSAWKSPLPQLRRSPYGSEDDRIIVSTCRRSPTHGGPNIRAGMAAVCQAVMSAGEVDGSASVSEGGCRGGGKEERGVPVYVMLPLDTVRPGGGGLNRGKAMDASLTALKKAGVEGVMADVWWGIVERERPGEYHWAGYTELFETAKNHGLKVQAVMSFHRCGGNVGDSCTIPLPRWVVEEMDRERGMAYTDQWGRRSSEYISLGCDALPLLRGRTPVQCYTDFMRAFRERFRDMVGSTIVEIQVGMGPAGELRYPSYPEQDGTWKFPGIGAFQCHDKYMLSSLRAEAKKAGKPEWCGPPTDAGGYHSWPEDTAFFRHDGGWSCPYGDFFLSWYSKMLLEHGETILSSATSIFQDEFVKISVKVAGIHWHYGTRSHAPELTAGYYNTRFRDGYLPIARMLGNYGALFNFTCVEMRDWEQPGEAQCRPEGLVRQVGHATEEAGVELAGENALPRYDVAAHDQIVKTAVMGGAGGGLGMMCGFTYLRMSSQLFHPDNWRRFVGFVRRMRDGKGTGGADERCLEQVEMEAAPLVREAAVALMND